MGLCTHPLLLYALYSDPELDKLLNTKKDTKKERYGLADSVSAIDLLSLLPAVGRKATTTTPLLPLSHSFFRIAFFDKTFCFADCGRHVHKHQLHCRFLFVARF